MGEELSNPERHFPSLQVVRAARVVEDAPFPPGAENEDYQMPMPLYVSVKGNFVLFEDDVCIPARSWHLENGKEAMPELAACVMLRRAGVTIAYPVDVLSHTLH